MVPPAAAAAAAAAIAPAATPAATPAASSVKQTLNFGQTPKKEEAPKIAVVPEPAKPKSKPPASTGGGEELESRYRSAMQQEMSAFAAELARFKEKASQLKVHVGTQEEKAALKGASEDMGRFCSDLREITLSQVSVVD